MKAFLGTINEELNRITEKAPYKQLPNRFPEEEIQQKVLPQVRFCFKVLQSEEWSNYMKLRENSIVTDLFGGQLLNIRQCQSCKDKIYSFDTFWDIALAFKKNEHKHTLEDLLSGFLKEENFIEDIECENCGNSKMTLSTQIWKLPEILVFTFKRFRHNYGYEKINDYVDFPVKNFNLFPFSKQSRETIFFSQKQSYLEQKTLQPIIRFTHSLVTLNIQEPQQVVIIPRNLYELEDFLKYYRKCKNRYDQRWYDHDDNDICDGNINDNDERYTSFPLILFYVKNA